MTAFAAPHSPATIATLVSRGPAYPGRVLKPGMLDDADVANVQARLVALGYALGLVDGDFGERTEGAVRLFQARSTDRSGDPLDIDGMVGPDTWDALFHGGEPAGGPSSGPSTLAAAALAIAAREVGVREIPPGSNRGPRVDEYVRSVGLAPEGAYAWCMAFVYWCFAEAARATGTANPCPRKASVQMTWAACKAAAEAGRPGIRIIPAEEAQRDPGLVAPGMVFFIATGGGTGHTGLVSGNDGGRFETIEGNTNDGGSREGLGVFRRRGRRVDAVNLGFASFS